MKLLLAVLVMVACAAVVVADEVDVPIGIEFGVSSITIKCANANYVYDKLSTNLSDNITCEQQVNLTTTFVNGTNASCTIDYDRLREVYANQTQSCGLTTLDKDELKAAFNDRTQNILNTQRDENNEIKNQISNFLACNNELSTCKNELKTAEIRATTAEANLTVMNARLSDKDGSIVQMQVLAGGAVLLFILSLFLYFTGIAGRIVGGMNSRGKAEYVEPPSKGGEQ